MKSLSSEAIATILDLLESAEGNVLDLIEFDKDALDISILRESLKEYRDVKEEFVLFVDSLN